MLFIFMIFFSTVSFSQDKHFGLIAGIGMSSEPPRYALDYEVNTSWFLSGKIGAFYEIQTFSENSFLEIQAVFYKMKSDRQLSGLYLPSIQGLVEYSESTERNYYSFAIPFYVGYDFGKFRIKGGVQPSLFLYHKEIGSYESTSGLMGEIYTEEGFPGYELGLVLGGEYQYNENWSICIDFNNELMYRAFNGGNDRLVYKNIQLYIGAKYAFSAKVK